MKLFLTRLLQFFAKLILNKYKPRIIALTGSVGKTSSKEAVFAVLKNYFDVRASYKNYNNELGVPLTIIGSKTGGRSLFHWLLVFFRALRLLILPSDYPKILVLEMGADHPGDIEKLTKLAPPEVAVVTAVSPVHLEFMGSIEEVAKEKRKLVESLPKNGVAVLNNDDERVLAMKGKTRARIITFGFKKEAEVQAIEMGEYLEKGVMNTQALGGINFKINYQGNVVPVFLSNVLGRQHVYAALVGASVGLVLGLNLVEISEGLKNYQAPAGRMRLIRGIKNTLIIDDTYNASPQAVLEALEVFARLREKENRRWIAVLGDMLELGSFTEEAHRQVGRKCREVCDLLVTVGERARFIADEAIIVGMPKERVMTMHTTEEAGHWLQEIIKEGDCLLIKGSQGMRMERIVKELMAEPLRAQELLVRQEKEWQ
jgi:UDP-N-acetylmuramoyl-tripeptide--D-alanyl-D-alanine ligase